MDYDSGVMTGWPVYADIPENEYKSRNIDNPVSFNTGFTFHIACVKDVETADEAIDKLISTMEKIEGKLSDEERQLYLNVKEIHKENGYMWLADYPKAKSEGISEDCQDEYGAFYDATDEIISNMKFFTPKVWKGTEQGAEVSFETSDLDGNPVNSQALFAANKVTMITIWGTTCGPCIQEMPELEKMNREFKEKGGAVVGLVEDVPLGNNAYLAEAKEIIKETGVTYVNLRAWDGFEKDLDKVGTPTAYFLDSQGRILGNPILGVAVNEYKEKMEEYLAEAGQ